MVREAAEVSQARYKGEDGETEIKEEQNTAIPGFSQEPCSNLLGGEVSIWAVFPSHNHITIVHIHYLSKSSSLVSLRLLWKGETTKTEAFRSCTCCQPTTSLWGAVAIHLSFIGMSSIYLKAQTTIVKIYILLSAACEMACFVFHSALSVALCFMCIPETNSFQ